MGLCFFGFPVGFGELIQLLGGQSYLGDGNIVANYSGKTYPVTLPEEIADGRFRRILTNREDTAPSLERRDSWLPWEAEIYLVEDVPCNADCGAPV